MALTSYRETLDYLYANLPIFQRIGAAAYKADLTNTIRLCEALGNPQHQFKSIHVAGTNGKGSSSHMLASILQSAGYRTGLYTSPHLKEFTERIRIDGVEVEKEFVIDFVNRIQPSIEEIKPSFFEITVAMAFDYFARQKVDIAVIEVGLGGRLDSTNVITPLVSLITNISWDHQDILGDTLQKIAFEKAGIIKRSVPVVISERQPEIAAVFEQRAREENAPIRFASERLRAEIDGDTLSVFSGEVLQIHVKSFPLLGNYQKKNVAGVMLCIEELKKCGFRITKDHIETGLAEVLRQTGLKGRWQKLGEHPTIYCDTGHNEAGIREVVSMIARHRYERLFMVIGMVKDKDIGKVLALLPKTGYYFFCKAQIPRALDALDLQQQAAKFNLVGEVEMDVNRAVEKAKARAGENDFIFIGGSTFVVAEVNGI